MSKLSTQARANGPNISADDISDTIINYLDKLNVKYVFGVPGGAIEPFVNALARSERRGGPRFIVSRHECGAVFMAEGYYRCSGKLGVVCTTTGPGATNLITGVSSAYAEKIPLLIITAQTALTKFGQRALQESSCTAVDTLAMFKNITQYNTFVSHPQQLEHKLIAALLAANTSPSGPAHLTIPSDILRMPSASQRFISSRLLHHKTVAFDQIATQTLCKRLNDVDNFIVLIGGNTQEHTAAVIQFVEHTRALFICTPTSKGWIDETHPQYRGVYGFAGHKSAKVAIQNPSNDLIIATGFSFNEIESAGWHPELLNHKLVHIDTQVEHFARTPMANLHVHGNMTEIFDTLTQYILNTHGSHQWNQNRTEPTANIYTGFFTIDRPSYCFADDTPLKPQRVFHFLSTALPHNTHFFIDAGNSWSWATHYLTTSNTSGCYHIAMEFGAMAWSIGAVIGAAIAKPSDLHVCVVGDGAYLMSAQEITVAAQYKLPIIFLVLNDAALGMVKHGQELGQQESIGWALNTVDYAAMATSMGVTSITVKDAASLNRIPIPLFDNTPTHAQAPGPILVDVHIDVNEVPPIGDRIRGLNANNKVTKSPN